MMELTDYLAALRRFWTTWLLITAAGLAGAVGFLLVTPNTYQATSGVFVSASPTVANSAAYVNTRVKSYPDVALSEAVLGPVITQLDLSETVAELRAHVTAINPVDTSQVNVIVSGPEAAAAADIANAVATQLVVVVEKLETPADGPRAIDLTLTDPATSPRSPVSPVASLVLTLGLVMGLFVGLAVAIVRSRMDTAVHTEDDVRAAWGPEPIDVLAPARGRSRQMPLTGRPEQGLARRLEQGAGGSHVRVSFYCPVPDPTSAARTLAWNVIAQLELNGVPAAWSGEATADSTQIEAYLVRAAAPPRIWRRIAASGDLVVVVLPRGTCTAAELTEVHAMLTSVGIEPITIVLTAARQILSVPIRNWAPRRRTDTGTSDSAQGEASFAEMLFSGPAAESAAPVEAATGPTTGAGRVAPLRPAGPPTSATGSGQRRPDRVPPLRRSGNQQR